MSESTRTVHIVDDDEAIRQSVGFMLRKAGHSVETYASGVQFLKTATREMHGCVLLDVRMPEIDGLEVQARLAEQGIMLPVIMLTGHGGKGRGDRVPREAVRADRVAGGDRRSVKPSRSKRSRPARGSGSLGPPRGANDARA
jgi:CheY-like chemotaxis protein